MSLCSLAVNTTSVSSSNSYPKIHIFRNYIYIERERKREREREREREEKEEAIWSDEE